MKEQNEIKFGYIDRKGTSIGKQSKKAAKTEKG